MTVMEVLMVKFFNPPYTVSIAWQWIEHHIGDKPYQKPRFQWRDLDEIYPYLRKAVLAGEDQRFLSHHGFDFVEMKQALKDILMMGKIRGASTISMQVARIVYLFPSRTVSRKLAEAYYTVLIELFWKKERILEIYLNTVDWGPGLMGAESASIKYFQTPADGLSPEQAALLAAILPSPHRWSPGHKNSHVNARSKMILKQIKSMPLLSHSRSGCDGDNLRQKTES